MRAVKATYLRGQVTLSELPAEQGPVEVLVVFPEPADDPWESILAEKTMRPAFAQYVAECLEEIKQGKTKPLDLDQL